MVAGNGTTDEHWYSFVPRERAVPGRKRLRLGRSGFLWRRWNTRYPQWYAALSPDGAEACGIGPKRRSWQRLAWPVRRYGRVSGKSLVTVPENAVPRMSPAPRARKPGTVPGRGKGVPRGVTGYRRVPKGPSEKRRRGRAPSLSPGSHTGGRPFPPGGPRRPLAQPNLGGEKGPGQNNPRESPFAKTGPGKKVPHKGGGVQTRPLKRARGRFPAVANPQKGDTTDCPGDNDLPKRS